MRYKIKIKYKPNIDDLYHLDRPLKIGTIPVKHIKPKDT